MGYIDEVGPEGSPEFNNSPQTTADLTRLRDLAVQRGNWFKGTTTAREEWSSDGHAVEGHTWYDTSLDRVYLFNGSGWIPLLNGTVPYTPALSRVTVGNGTVEGYWSRLGSFIIVTGRLVLGSTSVISAASGLQTVGVAVPTPMAPFYGAAGTNHDINGTVTLLDNGTEIYLGTAVAEASTSEVKLYFLQSSPVRRGPVNGTAPFTWQSGDILSWSFKYIAA